MPSSSIPFTSPDFVRTTVGSEGVHASAAIRAAAAVKSLATLFIGYPLSVIKIVNNAGNAKRTVKCCLRWGLVFGAVSGMYTV